MKKNYIITLLLTLCFTSLSFAQITELYISKYGEGSSNNKFLEIYNGTNAAISLDGYAFPNVSNAPTTAGEYEFWNSFTPGATIAAGDVYIIAHGSADASILAQADQTHNFLSNGDDGFALVKGGTHNDADMDGNIDAGEMTGFTIIDWLGDWNGDPGTGWEVAGVANATANHTLTRKASVCGPNNDWDASRGTNATDSEWIVGASNSGWDTLGSYSGCVTNPALSISSPSNNQIFPSTTTEVPITLSIENFTVSGDNGSGMSDNSGDGYLKTTLQETGQADQMANFFTATPDPITVVSGRSYTATVELVDNSGNSLSPKVEKSVSFSVALPCNIMLDNSTIATSCDANTSGIDTYQASIAFTGGTGTTYTITAKDGNNNDVGTIAGDNPSTTASGTITVTGIPEGTNITLKIVGDAGSSCDLTRTFTSPTCLSLPIYEPFDYNANTDLISQLNWKDASTANPPNNIQIKANDDGNGNPILNSYYTNNEQPNFTGNMISMVGSGSDPYIGFSDVTSGTIYASFTFHVTDMSSFQDPDGGYFAVFTEDGSFRERVWLIDPTAGSTNEGLTFNVGLSTTSGSSSNIHAGFTANLAEPVFVVMGYDLDNDEAKLWVVPDATSFGTNTPPAANVTIASASAGKINRFLLRQDSTNETPAIDIDELRIGTSWSEVAPSGSAASVGKDNIEGFATYPNPITNKRFTVSSNSTDKKEVVIFNVLGKKVFTTSFSGLKEEINISNINSGIYILKVTENGKTATKKLVVK